VIAAQRARTPSPIPAWCSIPMAAGTIYVAAASARSLRRRHTFTTAERVFIRALGDKIRCTATALTAYAIELRMEAGCRRPASPSRDGMVDEIVRRVRPRR